MPRFFRSVSFWIAAVAGLAVAAYLAFGVFGVQYLLIDKEVQETYARSEASEVAKGSFHPVTHPGTGNAIVYRLDDGSYTLRLENLDIFNGPALHVYLVGLPDATDAEAVKNAETIDLGPLRGNKGNQTYAVPAGFDPKRHRAATIWCKRFGVNFATAPLR